MLLAPKTQKQVKRFLGLAFYYRKFIKNYSVIADPINKLLKKNEKFLWSPECEKSFKTLINKLINPPILTFPDFKKEFFLTTDASASGLGAILSQFDENDDEKVIGYASRTTNSAEANYSATELECLGVVWGIETFRHYLYGQKFTILCDHNPLVYLDNTKNKHSKVVRWRLGLAEYQYTIKYKPGRKNTNADALSRVATNQISNSSETDYCKEEFSKAQDDDSEISLIKANLESDWSFSQIVGLLYKTKPHGKVIVVPQSIREKVLKIYQNDVGGGHLGFKKTWPKIRDRFFWKSMHKDTYNWIKSCSACACRKIPEKTRADLKPINTASLPFEMVDILGPLKETTNGNKYVLVFTDYLTRWPEAFPIKNREAKTIAKIFVNEIVARHSAPKTLLSDQAKEFMSSLVSNICEYLGTTKTNSTAYHPQTNGLTERFNATLCQILSFYVNENQTNWDEMLPIALMAYRTSVQETTSSTPFDLFYNRQARLPNDLENLQIKDTFTFDSTTSKESGRMQKKNIKAVNEIRR